MEGLLQHFEAELRIRGWDSEYFLCPGLTKEAVHNLFRDVAYPVPAALEALYRWRNGTATQSLEEFAVSFAGLDVGNQNVVWPDPSQPPLLSYRYTSFFREIGAFMPMMDALEDYQEAMRHEFWPKRFWPIFHDDSLLLDIDPESPTFGQVHIWSPSLLILDPEPYYDSLETMFTTYREAVRFGLVSPDLTVDPNFDAYYELAAKLNPLSTYWTS